MKKRKNLNVWLAMSMFLLGMGGMAGGSAVDSNSIVEDGIEYYIQTDKAVYNLGEEVQMLYRVTNLGNEDVTFSFPHSPEWNFWVEKDGEGIWRAVNGWYMVMIVFTLSSGESKEFPTYSPPYIWNMRDNNDNLVNVGEYDVIGGLYAGTGEYDSTRVSVHIEIVPETAMIYYVDADAAGVNDGSSWTDAYGYLQDALAAALSGDEIWVAQGIYKPDQGAGITPGNSGATFQLKNGVAIKGGYAGFGEPDPNACNIQLYETILSGDLLGNDDPDGRQTKVENSYHVVTGNGTDANAVLDGFTVSGGNANRQGHSEGGGMYNWDSSPTITNCTFRGNGATYGGGMSNYNNSNPTLTNCTFIGNSAGGGGGMANRDSSPTLSNCTFTGNTAGRGGGMYNWESNPTLTNCTFIGNSAGGGGGIYSDWSSPIIANCTISENIATASFGYGGGGLAYFRGSPTITNCVISGNRASWYGGGVCYFIGTGGVPSGGISITGCIITGNKAKQDGGGIYCSSYITKIANCTVAGNAAKWGGGMWNGSRHSTLTNCTFTRNSAEESGGGICNFDPTLTITNCILWADTPEEIGYFFVSVPSVLTYCDVQGGWLGEGNIDTDPFFAEPGYWSDANDPNIVVEPNDPNAVWIDGDYHLLLDSPCIDAGDPNYIAEPNETDLDGNPRVIGGRIDMGAYEYSPPVPAEVRIVPRTINLASKGRWISCYIWLGEDYDVADIDPNSIVLEDEIQAESLRVDEQQQIAIVRFDRSEVQGILNVGEAELTITGQLTDGTVFEGTDVIRVIDKGRKSAK